VNSSPAPRQESPPGGRAGGYAEDRSHSNRTEEQAVMSSEISRTDAAILAIEGPFRRLGWYLRTSGIIGRVTVGLLGAAVLLGALGSVVWLATSLGVAL
jgi:hypothetical protein